MLAVKILQGQGIKVTGLVFKSAFFDEKKAVRAARELKIPLKIVDISREHLEMVKKPLHGYGRAVNPCLDCHALMLKKAGRIGGIKHTADSTSEVCGCTPPSVKQAGKNIAGNAGNSVFDFIATGEVLGERPFSQTKKAMEKIQELSGLGDLLLRPLSSRLLPASLPEKKGWLDRKKLGNIQGRSRTKQLEMAKKYGLKRIPQPSGGCMLAERGYSKKLLQLFQRIPACTPADVGLLRMGRAFYLPKKGTELTRTMIVFGRDEKENQSLVKAAKKGDILLVPKNFAGPSALLRTKSAKKFPDRDLGKAKPSLVKFAKNNILKYTPMSKRPQAAKFSISKPF